MKRGFYREFDEIYGIAINGELSKKENRYFNSYNEVSEWLEKNRGRIGYYCKKNIDVKRAFEEIHNSSITLLKKSLPKIEEFAEYIRNRETLKIIDHDLMILDAKMYRWVNKNKRKLEMLSNFGSEDADLIIKASEDYIRQKSERRYKRIEEAYDYLQTVSNIYQKDAKKFSDGVDIRFWLYRNSLPYLKRVVSEKNCPPQIKEKIEYIISRISNETSTKIHWQENKFNKKIDELYEYIKKYDNVPTRRSRETFSDGVIIGIWINTNYNRLKKLSLNGNEKAQEIFKQIKKRGIRDKITIEERLKEIRVIIENGEDLPSIKNNKKFSNGVIIYSWYASKLEEIKKLSTTNEDAKIVFEKMNNRKEIVNSRKLKELEEYYNTYGKLPGEKSKTKFRDNTDMYLWLFNNREYIKKSAQDGNGFARELDDILTKRQVSRNINFDTIRKTREKRIDKIYEDYQKTGNIKAEDMRWIKFNNSGIKRMIVEGNHKAETLGVIYETTKHKKELRYLQFLKKKYEYEAVSKKVRENKKYKINKIQGKKYTLTRRK